MELISFQLLFFTGILPTVFQSAPRQYHLIQNIKNWTEAQAFCRHNFADLATVETSTDMANLVTEAKKQNYLFKVWVGLYNDVNSWRWSLNDNPIGVLQKWASMEPNNYNGHEECVKMDKNGLWYDAICSQTNFFLCYDAKNTTKFFLITDRKRTWKNSQAYCRQHYTDLASPVDKTENEALMAKIPSGTVWIGLYRDSWKWSDKTNVSTILWKTNQPDSAKGHENCVSEFDGVLSDESCSIQHAFFCQTHPTTKTLTSVVVQSSNDVNDPAVRAVILEKMQQKLQELGMAEGTTLAWREQPNGMVFYKKEEDNNVETTTSEACKP